MFDKLEDILRRYEEIMNELSEPTVTADQKRFTSLMKEQADLTPLVETSYETETRKEGVNGQIIIRTARGKYNLLGMPLD